MFSDSEINKRKLEERQLRVSESNLDIYNPITAPFNDKATTQPTAKEIFWGDTNQIIESKYITADIEMNTDDGLCYEMGVCSGINIVLDMLKEGMTPQEILNKVPYKTILAHCSDIRLDSKGYEGFDMPFGINQYNKGGIDSHGKIFRHFEDIVAFLEEESRG
ncbi:uncharacterized protein CBO05P1_089 [Clostridium botulinum B str. Osaka05]|uniref:Uncharacterized protein n=2 Tax=Clostridium botulinum TaxID=1491 RepID=A0A060N8N1_CLOBO|nr:uncharacterized protein CBO05P1_089 [Clostridium botulinum B str. Osaka05]